MKTFTQYFTESYMTAADFEKHDYKYSNAVIAIITGEHETLSQLALGDKSAQSYVDLEKIQKDRNAVEAFRHADSVAEFNKIAKKFGFSWGKIWKGPFSGYDGEVSKNKGNAFESELIKNFNDSYKADLEKIIGPFELAKDPEAVGELNTRRPLTFDNGMVYALPQVAKKLGNKFEIGEAVSDVTLTVNEIDGKVKRTETPVYLSLKYGNKVTFINAGVMKLFPKAAFVENDADKITKNGAELLDMFGIDKNKFVSVFANYSGVKSKKAKGESEDVTEKIAKNKAFAEFIKSVIGYGFIVVHKIGKKVHYYDLRTEEQMNAFIGVLKSAQLYYGGKTNDGKRVDIYMEFESNDYKLSLQFNIRSKQGGVYPTHIMSDYVVTQK